MAALGTAVIPASVSTTPDAEVGADYAFRRYNYGTGAIPTSVGTAPDVEVGENYTFRRYHYGVGAATWPRLAFPRGTNPAR